MDLELITTAIFCTDVPGPRIFDFLRLQDDYLLHLEHRRRTKKIIE